MKYYHFIIRVYKITFIPRQYEVHHNDDNHKFSCWRTVQSFLLTRADEEHTNHDDCAHEQWTLLREVPLVLSQDGESLVARFDEQNELLLEVRDIEW